MVRFNRDAVVGSFSTNRFVPSHVKRFVQFDFVLATKQPMTYIVNELRGNITEFATRGSETLQKPTYIFFMLT